ncbi:Nitric oxide dioxygenase [Pseudonocardia dioxanivorans CB1190]|uniref:Nitric oxide dioxygenase n=1 Tax=Pseudonocardia dioxanivorans (strain ATCC 55486 / DSM 44775 / JCM 13855 / CB1190) TaxID=675635 RepID=F4CYY7_PSEUX|nr:MOSC and FAD-binding oxidoreductase domain-containing protein [Pseudonocardia dioxanivorans]AEA27712.1 Nitric oxide dioxygenase [Pseudonocardia dioxanivorans CB1190]
MPNLVSVNAGMPRDIAWNGVTIHTGAWKDPVDGPRLVRRLGLDGDGQGDTYGHGGPNRAVLVYQVESYEYWRRHFGRDDLRPGCFAENLTVEGLGDSEVCIGDRYRIGEAEFEVSQPRVTCFRAGLRIGEPELAALLVAHHRPGFYMRVITEGEIRAGDEVVRVATGHEQVTVAAVDALLYLPDPDVDTLRRALRIPALSPGWQGSLRQLLDEADHPDAAHGPAPDAGWTGFRDLQVTDVVRETSHVSSFVLASPEGARLPEAGPGQYVTLRLPGECGDLVRSYSLSAARPDGTYRISVKREPGGLGSGYLHDTVHPGTTLEVAAPRGEFVLDDGTAPVVLASAGIGITPVLAMLHRLAAEHSPRCVWWLHAARQPEEQAFAAETEALLSELPHVRTRTYYSAADGTCPAVDATPGRLTATHLADLDLPRDAVAYVCGPTGFMTDVTAGLVATGLDPRKIHTETFGALTAINPGVVRRPDLVPRVPPGPPGTGPTVSFARSGISAPFDESRANILEFAEACHIPTRWQCRTGVCQTCQTPVLTGEVDYAPSPLTDPPPGTVLVCCARPRSEIVLDM